MSKILLIGGGGHCKSVLDSLLAAKTYENIAILDRSEKLAEKVLEIPISGVDSELEDFRSKGFTDAFITIGSIGNPAIRAGFFSRLKKMGFRLPNIIDPTASVSPFAKLGAGIFIGKRAIVNAESEIGDGAILNTACVVEHECRVGALAHIAPGAVLCGNVTVGENTHIGAGSVVKQGVTIGRDVLVGAGSNLLSDLPEGVTAYGNPCRIQGTQKGSL